jgi:hypothetical protein
MTNKPIIKIPVTKIYNFKRMSNPKKYKHLMSTLRMDKCYGSNRHSLKSTFHTYVKLYKSTDHE